MTEPPLSRFAGQHPKPRPTHTLIVPVTQISEVLSVLLLAGEAFTVEPSLTQAEVWHFGLFESGVAAITENIGPTATLNL